MRRAVAITLVAVGSALLVLGLSLKYWAYPRLATVPLDLKSTTMSVGENMAVLVIRDTGVEVKRGVTVTSTQIVDGNVSAALDRGDGNSAFWETSVESVSARDGVLSQSVEGVSFDRVTGETTNCCGDYVTQTKIVGDQVVEENEAVTHEGLYYKFPFDTQKQDYPFWDGDLGKATDAAYAGTEDVEGISTYKFVQSIPDTTLETLDVPGSLFDDTLEGNVSADLVYANTRTLWVEPNTGVIIKGQEELNKRLVWNALEAPATVGTIGYTEQTVRETVDEFGAKSMALGLIGGGMPLLVAILGGALLLLGLGSAGSGVLRGGAGRRVAAQAAGPDTVDLRDVEQHEHN